MFRFDYGLTVHSKIYFYDTKFQVIICVTLDWYML